MQLILQTLDITMVFKSAFFTFKYILRNIGPILNPNLNWKPTRQQAALDAGTKGSLYAPHMPGMALGRAQNNFS